MCLKGKIEAPKKPGNFQCKKCGAVSKQKDNMCKPAKIKKTKSKKKKAAKKKTKTKGAKSDKKKSKKKKKKT
ncbi:MAG: hypothetical protein JSW50_08755 [Candidatus Latescibacterota bacterium]|nr:MAG: hypothetical protein JSW50_08755 [Candidatus Latescibacterota bacterium]